MAAFDTSRPYAVAPRFESFLSRMIGKIIGWNDARVIRSELSRLTDRELDDIGLSRADIETVARAR
jgi:uncharacterized protein YjiS (DUF1127 family)